jgi:fatty-acyl-CoA synthase
MDLRERLAAAAALARAGLTLERPDRLPRAALAAVRWGPSLAAAVAGAAARYPERVAVVDPGGATSYAELWARTNAIAHGLMPLGVRAGSRVGVLCRNGRAFVEATIAVSKLGADLVFLNTAFAGPQLADVVRAEQIDVVLHDDELGGLLEQVRACATVGSQAFEELASSYPNTDVRPPTRPGRVVILTSGTTGRPKGAGRGPTPAALTAGAALLDRVPLRVGDRTLIAPPLFHAWGLGHLSFAMSLSSTAVLAPGFEPEATLAAIERHAVTVLIVVPVMLRRILDLGDAVRARYDTSSLRVIASSGAALGAPLVSDALEAFGPILYNIYGSTEVAVATIATPADLTVAPSTAGRTALGTTVRILDADGAPVPAGETGRIFVGSGLRFEGYTGGGGKEVVDGLLSVGDVGHLDTAGRLFVEGRDDEMIVSGGENVFPSEVEDLLAGHPAVRDVAVVGVADDEFGQRLRAVVVRTPGAKLSAAEVRSYVRDHLARYKVPRDVVFVDELPRNAMHKVLRSELRDPSP